MTRGFEPLPAESEKMATTHSLITSNVRSILYEIAVNR